MKNPKSKIQNPKENRNSKPETVGARLDAGFVIHHLSFVILLLLSTLNLQLSTFAQGTAFTYQGRVSDGAGPANGNYDLTFTLFSAVSGGATAGTSNVFDNLAVTNGLFTATL